MEPGYSSPGWVHPLLRDECVWERIEDVEHQEAGYDEEVESSKYTVSSDDKSSRYAISSDDEIPVLVDGSTGEDERPSVEDEDQPEQEAKESVESEVQSQEVHEGVRCDRCLQSPLRGTRRTCRLCNTDVCSKCFRERGTEVCQGGHGWQTRTPQESKLEVLGHAEKSRGRQLLLAQERGAEEQPRGSKGKGKGKSKSRGEEENGGKGKGKS